MQRFPSFSRPLSRRRTIPANSVEPRGAESMAVNLSKPDASSLYPVSGVTLGTAMAGVRKANRRDVTVVLLEPGAAVAGVFTANRFCAAPVQVCREHLVAGPEVRAIPVSYTHLTL